MDQLPLTIPIMAFIFGSCIGSFLNVVIHRLPAGLSVVTPPSHCPFCERAIPFYLNIPILSYIVLRGKCGFCKTPISIRYPGVEFLTGMLGLVISIKFGVNPAAFFWFAFGTVLVAISFIDLDHQIIPDRLSLPGIVIFSTSFLFIPEMTWVAVLGGIIVGGGILYAVALAYYFLRKQQGMGGGDIKLLAMIGAATGIKGVFFTLFTGSVLGTIAGVAGLIFDKKRGRQTKIPFGPFLSAGAIIYVLWGKEIIFWYYSFLGRY